MCGICGVVGDASPELLRAMADAIAHRGPDDSGYWLEPKANVGLGHRRLSIIDLSPAGHQPMSNEDGTVWIAFNGEIYDFQKLREDLAARGHTFRSHSDTEVLIHLYEEHGPDFVQYVNGMFALAIWDTKREQLVLARDHAGIKPLYYCIDGERLYFGSEIKSLLRVPGIPRELNHAALPDLLTFLWVPGDQTMLRGIHKLEPGHLMVWRRGKAEIRRWFNLAYEPDDAVSEDEWVEQVRDTFMRTTARQMVSDVPLGAFLSGGADSSSIVACMRHSFPNRPIKCYTAHFEDSHSGRDQFVDDYPYARRVADHLGVELKSFPLQPSMISLLPKMVYHLDEPDADPAVFPSYLISKMAREDGTTVLLSGTGGDEVFFGYRSHQAYRQYERWQRVPRSVLQPALAGASGVARAMMGAQRALPRRLQKFQRALAMDGLERHMALVDWSSDEARAGLYSSALRGELNGNGTHTRGRESLERYFDSFEGRGEINRHTHVLIQTFLAAHNFLYTDKSSMAASLEVRVPFLDLELMRLCARIPERYKLRGNVTKSVLKKAMERYLPREVLHRSKTGFGVPLRDWMVGPLRPVVDDLLSESRLRQRGLFDPQGARRLIEENLAGRGDHAYMIYALLTLEVWQQTFIDRPGEQISLG